MSSGDMQPIHLGGKGKKTEEREGKKKQPNNPVLFLITALILV